MSKTQIKFKFKFVKPLEIVPADKIVIKVRFGEFEQGLGEEVIIFEAMKNQLPEGGLPELKQIAETVQ